VKGALASLLCLAALTRPAAAEIGVPDDTGATVRLAAPAARIVTLAPHATELVYAAGAGTALVATVEHSDEPEAARHIPRLGGLAGIDRERLLAAQPDLVVGWASGNPPGLLAWLERRGIPVFRSEPTRLADVDRSVGALAVLAGLPPPAPPAAAPVVELPAPVRALFLFWEDPPIAAGDTHVLSDVLRTCGATPAIAGLRGKSVVVSREALLAARPDLVFLTDGRVMGSDRRAGASSRLAELLLPSEERLALSAAQRPGPRLHQAAAVVCRQIAAVAAGRR
jgi:iron complex transport system substrate-binding protein